MKLIIQIPCYNEEATLGVTLQALPREIPGIDTIERLVIDDGSTDATVQVAQAHGVEHVVRLPRNRGLAAAFTAGLEACLMQGADIIVNTDGDNQYCAADMHKLVQPIVLGKADIVVGARPISDIKHFSPLKKLLQKIGSRVVRIVSHADVQDAPSGFRAFSRDAAMRLNVFSKYTYTLETIVQAGQKGMAVQSVPVGVNEDARPSRLVKSVSSYVRKSATTLIRFFVVYKPFRFFMAIGIVLFSLGFLFGLRFVYYYITEGGTGHVQSVVLAGILLGMGFQTMLVAFLADLLSINRELLEDVQYRIRKLSSRKKDE